MLMVDGDEIIIIHVSYEYAVVGVIVELLLLNFVVIDYLIILLLRCGENWWLREKIFRRVTLGIRTCSGVPVSKRSDSSLD